MLRKFTLLLTIVLCGLMGTAQLNIGSSSAPDASAVLQLTSTSKGLLPPRLTQAQRNAISTPTAGLMIYCTNCASGEPEFYNGTNWISMAVAVPNVTNATTGKTWMDRNLGASEVATSSTDSAAYGYLYQWGRGADGHQLHTSATTATLSSTDVPVNGLFIVSGGDWRSPQNDNLWQGVSGINNPCPGGYRLPTETELTAESNTFNPANAAGAFTSVLKLTMAGYRDNGNGSLNSVGANGNYWTSTVSGTNIRRIGLDNSTFAFYANVRAFGFSVRCIKN